MSHNLIDWDPVSSSLLAFFHEVRGVLGEGGQMFASEGSSDGANVRKPDSRDLDVLEASDGSYRSLEVEVSSRSSEFAATVVTHGFIRDYEFVGHE